MIHLAAPGWAGLIVMILVLYIKTFPRVTFRQELVKAQGFRSVPVVEANGRCRVGNTTSAQLLDFQMDAT
jgi:hypothetical protein